MKPIRNNAAKAQPEIGCEVEVSDLVLVRASRGWNREFSEHDGDIHGIEFMLICSG